MTLILCFIWKPFYFRKHKKFPKTSTSRKHNSSENPKHLKIQSQNIHVSENSNSESSDIPRKLIQKKVTSETFAPKTPVPKTQKSPEFKNFRNFFILSSRKQIFRNFFNLRSFGNFMIGFPENTFLLYKIYFRGTMNFWPVGTSYM